MTGNNGYSKPTEGFKIVGSKMEEWVDKMRGAISELTNLDGEIEKMSEPELTYLLERTKESIIMYDSSIKPKKEELRLLEESHTALVELKWKVQRKLTPITVVKRGEQKTPKALNEDDQILYKNMNTSQLIRILGKDDALELIKRGRHHNY